MPKAKSDQQIYDESILAAQNAAKAAVKAAFRLDPDVIPGEHAELVAKRIASSLRDGAAECRVLVAESERLAHDGAVQQAGAKLAEQIAGKPTG